MIKIEVVHDDHHVPMISVDGRHAELSDVGLTFNEREDAPFAMIYIHGERSYDTELWVDGALRGKTPAHTPDVEALWDEWEAMPPFRSPLGRLFDEIEAHPGTRARREWDAIRYIHVIMLGNEHELLSLIDAIEANHDDLALVMISNVGPLANREAREFLYQQLVRLVHNYLAATTTFVDHTRNLMSQYSGTPTHSEYLRRVEEVKATALSPFVKQLRNYLLHYRLPRIGVSFSVDNEAGTETIKVYLDRDAALEWTDWQPAARSWLQGQPERQIPLRIVIDGYRALLDEKIYTWLYEQFTVLHAADVAAVNKLIEQTPGWRRSDGTIGDPNWQDV